MAELRLIRITDSNQVKIVDVFQGTKDEVDMRCWQTQDYWDSLNAEEAAEKAVANGS